MARSPHGPRSSFSEPFFRFCGDTIRRAVVTSTLTTRRYPLATVGLILLQTLSAGS